MTICIVIKRRPFERRQGFKRFNMRGDENVIKCANVREEKSIDVAARRSEFHYRRVLVKSIDLAVVFLTIPRERYNFTYCSHNIYVLRIKARERKKNLYDVSIP